MTPKSQLYLEYMIIGQVSQLLLTCIVVQISQGCVCFTIRADNLTALTTLWNMYQDGTLKLRLQDFFLTEEMRQLVDGEEKVEVTVTIEEEEYEKACWEFIREAEGTFYNM